MWLVMFDPNDFQAADIGELLHCLLEGNFFFRGEFHEAGVTRTRHAHFLFGRGICVSQHIARLITRIGPGRGEGVDIGIVGKLNVVSGHDEAPRTLSFDFYDTNFAHQRLNLVGKSGPEKFCMET